MKKIFLFSLFVVILGANCSYGDDAVLEWDENSDADYYVVYWSTDPDSFTEENSMEIPADITYIELEDSSDGQEYYYSVKAFNECGNSSDFSDTVVSAHLPADVSYGDVITGETLTSKDASIGAQGGGGCFIGSMGFVK